MNGRFGHEALLSTPTSIVCFGPDPGVVAKANPLRRKRFLAVLPIIAPKPLLAWLSLNQSRAVPELCPPPKQVRRTDSVIFKAAFVGTSIRARRLSVMVLSFALLKPLLPLVTLLSCPSPTLA